MHSVPYPERKPFGVHRRMLDDSPYAAKCFKVIEDLEDLEQRYYNLAQKQHHQTDLLRPSPTFSSVASSFVEEALALLTTQSVSWDTLFPQRHPSSTTTQDGKSAPDSTLGALLLRRVGAPFIRALLLQLLPDHQVCTEETRRAHYAIWYEVIWDKTDAAARFMRAKNWTWDVAAQQAWSLAFGCACLEEHEGAAGPSRRFDAWDVLLEAGLDVENVYTSRSILGIPPPASLRGVVHEAFLQQKVLPGQVLVEPETGLTLPYRGSPFPSHLDSLYARLVAHERRVLDAALTVAPEEHHTLPRPRCRV